MIQQVWVTGRRPLWASWATSTSDPSPAFFLLRTSWPSIRSRCALVVINAETEYSLMRCNAKSYNTISIRFCSSIASWRVYFDNTLRFWQYFKTSAWTSASISWCLVNHFLMVSILYSLLGSIANIELGVFYSEYFTL